MTATPPRGPVNTPGLLGYAVSVAVSLVILAVGIGEIDAAGPDPASDAPAVVVIVLIVGVLPAVFLGGLGAMVVHLTCRRVGSQVWHVLLAALLGAGVGLAVFRGDVAA